MDQRHSHIQEKKSDKRKVSLLKTLSKLPDAVLMMRDISRWRFLCSRSESCCCKSHFTAKNESLSATKNIYDLSMTRFLKKGVSVLEKKGFWRQRLLQVENGRFQLFYRICRIGDEDEREITDHRFKDNNKWRTQSLLYVIRQIWWDFLDLSTRKKRWSTRTKRLTLQIVKICTTECLSHLLLLSCIWIILDDESQEQDNEKKTFSSSSVRFSVLDVWRKDLKKQVPSCAQHIYLELSNNDDEEVAGLDNKE